MRYLISGSHFHRFEYTYDDSGNRITLVDTPDVGAATSWDYGYDYLNRLTSVTRGSSTTLYAYDESDNRISLTLPSGDEWTYGFDLADQITSRSFTPSGGSLSVVETYTHDDDGNMDSRTQGGVTTTYDWNTLNRLRQVKVGSAVSETTSYDHGGIRRLKVDGGGSSKSFSSGAMSLADTRPSGPVSFVQGHQLLGLEQGGNLYFMITDGLSSVRKVVNSSGVSQGEFKFDEFGVPESSTTPPADLSAHSYVGGLGQRNEGGLYYARQRWYDPQLGRWLSADPIGFRGGLNLYTGMKNNPTSRVDPSGLWPFVKIFYGAYQMDKGDDVHVAARASTVTSFCSFRLYVSGRALVGERWIPLQLHEEAPYKIAKAGGLGRVATYQDIPKMWSNAGEEVNRNAELVVPSSQLRALSAGGPIHKLEFTFRPVWNAGSILSSPIFYPTEVKVEYPLDEDGAVEARKAETGLEGRCPRRDN